MILISYIIYNCVQTNNLLIKILFSCFQWISFQNILFVTSKFLKIFFHSNITNKALRRYFYRYFLKEYIRGAFNKFPDIFVQAFKIVVDSCKFSMLLLYILWDDWSIFMISRSNELLQQELGYTQLNPDCHSWLISKMQSGLRRTICNKILFGKNAMQWKPDLLLWPRDQETEFRMEACWLSQTQEGQKEQIHQQTFDDSFLFWQPWQDLHALGSHWTDSQQGILCWGFKGVQEEIPREKASTLQIGSVAFAPGQCTSPQLHLCHRLFDQDGHQVSYSPPYRPDLARCDFWLFPKLRGCCYEEMKEAATKVIDMLRKEDLHEAFQKLLERHNQCIAAGEDYFEGD